jgi:hypothetical protein
MNTTPCPPGEVHPAYAQQARILSAWLNDRGGRDHLNVHRQPPMTFDFGPQLGAAPPDHWLLTRRKAHGPAPYVGRAYVYAWYVGEDSLGRMVAGDAWIQYVDGGSPSRRE